MRIVAEKSSGRQMAPIHSILVIAAYRQLTPPFRVKRAGPHSAIILSRRSLLIVAKAPIGAVIIGITVFALAYAAGDKRPAARHTALSELSNSSLIWLIVVAFMIARGFIKTGLGRRIALAK